MSLRIAIIGGVAGGAGAAAAARRANEAAQIDLYEMGDYISFANCGLPYYLSGEIESRDKLLVTSPEQLRERFNVSVHVRHEVTSIDRKRRAIRVRQLDTMREFEAPYDRLIIATGAKGFRPPTLDFEHPRVHECRTLHDIDAIANLIERHTRGRALVIGGGFIGVEVAEALVQRDLSVTLVDLAPQILPPLDPEIAAAGLEPFARRHVSLRLGTRIERVVHERDESYAILSNGERIAFDLAVMSIGVTPEISLAKDAGLEIGATGGLVVDEFQRTSDPDIFAAGDVTELLYWPTGTRMRIALAGPANKQGRVAGANAVSDDCSLQTRGAAGTAIVRLFELVIGMTGLSEKAAQARKIPYKVIYTQNNHHAGYFPGARPIFIKLLFSPETGRVLGGQIFGESGVDKRIDVLSVAIQAGFTVDQLADADLAYAPPFGSAKDPIVIAGMVASNVWHGRSNAITPRELLAAMESSTPPLVLDVRSSAEHNAGRIEGSINIPVDSLRTNRPDVPRDREIVVHCAVGYRGYVAERMLRQLGYSNVRNLSGGFRAWSLHHAAEVG
ncbi:MAG: FAD-dependent oxidoreductase [Phycisphaerae bacterium]|nr:FAD-dependent oxidoreductase [Phycisphaerae bacterium]